MVSFLFFIFVQRGMMELFQDGDEVVFPSLFFKLDLVSGCTALNKGSTNVLCNVFILCHYTRSGAELRPQYCSTVYIFHLWNAEEGDGSQISACFFQAEEIKKGTVLHLSSYKTFLLCKRFSCWNGISNFHRTWLGRNTKPCFDCVSRRFQNILK